MAKKILILGVNGFIGTALKEYIEERIPGWDVWGVTRSVKGRQKNVIVADLNQANKIEKFLHRLRPDIIFNCAGGRAEGDQKAFADNVLAVKRLLGVLEKSSTYHPRLILLGSAAEYGRPLVTSGLIDEKQFPNPFSWYGCVKLMQTNLGLMYAGQGVDVVVGRIFNITGKKLPDHLALGNFSKQIALMEAGKMASVIHSQGLNINRDFLDIHDVCSALCKIALKGKPGEIYNICASRLISLRSALKVLIKKSRLKRPLKFDECPQDQAIIKSIGGRNSKLRRQTGWKPSVSLDRSLDEMLNSYRVRYHP